MKEKTTKSLIVQVHFFEPVEGKTDYYFGSLKAIYAKFTKEQVGISLDSLLPCNPYDILSDDATLLCHFGIIL